MRIRSSFPARLAAACAVCAAALPAVAQHNIEKLKQFKVATTDLNIPLVEQSGRNADVPELARALATSDAILETV